MSEKRANLGAMFGAPDATTFLGLPAATLAGAAGADIAILGVATATPYPWVGAYCADAPRAIRSGIARLAPAREHMDFDLGGRMLPEGVTYQASWIEKDGSRCFQIMEAPSLAALNVWVSRWEDLVDFDITPVMTSADFWAQVAS